ncbi:hypothetical protein SFRURICE_009479 [Spodoptera frugiperda]|nr:hypothetical protein SFRURICE_009479 [Spodoptera frugiperda]
MPIVDILQGKSKRKQFEYGQQYEPGGYAAAVQQRTNMTQREDALKFEQGRIKALQEERLHIQKKTFTKWINSFLQKARMEVDDLFVDLADGRRLLKLLEIISGERLPRPNSGRMRVHKIENVNKSLSFLHTKVRLESIGAEDIVDGNPRLILGLIWTIILRFQIQEIEIDVDEENESSEKKSAKDALLLWCQRKTSGYHGVHIHNFTDSWRSGLGFNALIHAHRPDLFRWSEVPVTDHVETLNHAFDVAHKHLGIPRLLDAEDVDTSRPDEKSVMTYVASYYHTFARMKNEQKSGRRIANLLEWILLKIQELNGREFPNSLDGIQRLLLSFKQYRTVEKPPKYKERSEIEALYFDINTMQKSLTGEAWAPLEGQLPQDLERAWQQLEQSVLRKGYLKEMIQVLSDPRYGSNLAQVDATVKKHEAISADILARTERFEDLSAMAAELVRENYHGAEAVSRTEQAVLTRWNELLELLERHRSSLAKLAHLMALLREADTVGHTLTEMKAQFQSEEVGRHLVDVERLLQAHALQELQLGALDETIRRLVRQGASADGAAQPKQQLTQQLTQLTHDYDSLVAAAKDRKARLEDARNLYQFLEDHDEEEGWVTEKQRICRTEVAAKELRAVLALRQKHTALLHELRARDHVSQRHRAKGQSLIDAKHPKSAEIERRLTSLNKQWQILRELAAAREKQLADAAEAHQFYGDANEAESWMKEKRPLVATDDCGRDAPSAGALLARHKVTHDELRAHAAELHALRAHADRLHAAGITCLQLPTEVESTPAIEEEEWVNESRLVPTEVWEEEPVERLEHRTVKALYAFTGQGISMQKGEIMFLINKTNPDWWSVRKADRTDGFVPANYVREIEPRVVPVNELLTLSAARRAQLEDAIKLYSFFAECDDFDKWIKDKEKMLRADDADDSVDTAKRKYEKFVTDLSAASKRLEHIDAAAEELVQAKHSQAGKATARRNQLRQQWERLLRLKQQKEKTRSISLYDPQIVVSGLCVIVELFSRTCDEALDWMAEKEQQLAASSAPAADLRTVRALQRRHAQLERELEPYPNERGNVEGRQKEIQQMWERCQAQAAERRSRLESAVGHQIFGNSSATLTHWMQKVREQLAQEASAKDVATAEALHKQHQELMDDIKAHDDEFKEVIALGKQLLANNPALTDVADKIKSLETDHDAKDAYLKQLVQLQSFNRECDQIDASTGAHEAYLEYKQFGSSVDEAEALVKRHEELEARLAAQDERLATFVQRAEALEKIPHYAADHIAARRAAVLQRRDGVRRAAAERRRALLASLAHQQFVAATEELQNWIQDKTRTAKDQSYRDLANLERKLQKHEAFERELQANEKQLRNVESIGQSLQKSDPSRASEVSEHLSGLQTAWEELVAASRDKGSKLRQAAQQRKHRRSVEDAKARLIDLERQLKSEEFGTDLRSCKRLLNQHQALEQELSLWESKAGALAAQGADLVSGGHFDAEAIERDSAALLKAVRSLQPPAATRRQALESSLQLHKFAAEVAGELDWLSERSAAASSEVMPTDLHAAQSAQKKHAKLKAELLGRRPLIERVIAHGNKLVEEGHPQREKIESLCEQLEAGYTSVSEAAESRASRLEAALKAQQFMHDALEVDAWLADKAAALAHADLAKDRHRATHLLTRHKAVELELDTYAAIISEMGHVATSMANGGHPEGEALLARHALLAESLARLQRLAAQRQKALVESILRSKFDELRHRVESGAERFNQCEELAKKLLATESPYIGDIEKRQEALGEWWQRLVEQMESRASRLHAAGEIHRFHRDVAELAERAGDATAALAAPPPPRDLRAATAALRAHDTMQNDLLAIDAQMQVLLEEGNRLQKLYPGGNVQQIELQQKALEEAWTTLRQAADDRRHTLQQYLQLHQFLTQVRDLTSWSVSLRSSMSGPLRVRDAVSAQSARAEHDAVRAELDARDGSFRDALNMGRELATQHPNAAEVEEKCEALLEERNRLHGAWAARQVALDQLIDLHCFLRDAKLLHDLCATQEAALSTEISQTSSVEEDEKLATLNSHGDKLLQQNHLYAESGRRRAALVRSRARAQFARDAAEARGWVADKLNKLAAEHQHGEVTNLEDKIKKLQKHQAFTAELAANRARLQEVQLLAEQLRPDAEVEKQLQELQADWQRLETATEQRGRGLEEAQDILEFNQHLDKIEAWIRDKEMMVQAHELGRDYEHCSALLRKLDDMDSDMKVDDRRVKSICALADKLLQQGPTQQAAAVSQRRDAFLAKWHALSGALQKYRDNLSAALEIHSFNRDVEDTAERISKKATLFSSSERGRELTAAQELKRRHLARAAEAGAIRDKIQQLEGEGKSLTQKEEPPQPPLRLGTTAGVGSQAYCIELELWVSEAVKRMDETGAPETVSDAEALLELHHEKKAEIDGRQKAISSLQKEAEQVPEKAHQLQLLKEQARQTEDWLASKEAFLNNDDLGENLDETLIRKHVEFSKLLHSQLGRVDELQRFAASMLEDQHFDRDYVETRLKTILNRRDKLVVRKDLASVTALLKRHSRLEQQVSSKTDSATQLADNARQLADSNHFMAEEILKKADHAVKRYRQLQEPMQIRRDNLEDAALLHRWDRDADEEFRWYGTNNKGFSHSRWPTIAPRSLRVRGFRRAITRPGRRTPRVGRRPPPSEPRLYATDLISEITEAEAWLLERRVALVSGDVGRDEDSALALVRRLDALQREVTGFDATIVKLEKTAAGLVERSTIDGDQLQKRISELKTMHEDMKLLFVQECEEVQEWISEQMTTAASEEYGLDVEHVETLQQAFDNFLAQLQGYESESGECEEVQEWISEQMTTAASEEYGLDVEHVETLQQAFDNFLAQLQANEGRIEGVCEAGTVLLEENTPEADRVKQRIDDIKGLWDDLKELALARQEALAGARQVHEFDRSAEETAAWVAEKDSALGSEALPPRSLHELHAQKRSLHALRADLDAIKAAHDKLQEEAERLGTAFPDAKEHVSAKLEDVTESLQALVQRADQCNHQLELAGQLQAYFDTYQELLAWTNETLARVTAPDLATDVSGAERLLARHQDIKVEIEAKEDAFQTLYSEKLVKEGHFMSNEIEDRMSILRSRRAHLDAAWANRERIYTQHLDALVFKRDADALDNWITNRVPLVRDGKYGESVAQVEELINRHRDLEETIDAQRDKFNALKRITLVEQAFQMQRDEEEQARRKSAERQEADRLQQYRKREMERITEERRRETAPVPMAERLQTSVAPASSEETLSPAPQFDRLPKNDQHVKRAESMSVVKTQKRFLERKQEAGRGGKRATVRSWRAYYSVLCGQLLCFFRDELDFASAKAAAPPVAILNARCEPAGDYTKRANVFRLACADGAEYLFACSSKDLMKDWVAKLSFHAQLPPELQLTPYSSVPPGESPTAEIRRRLHENAESSSSAPSSPEPEQSEVLPSLPPRQPPPEEDAAEVVFRNQEQAQASSWGRSRFSNGRDINTEFIRSQQQNAYGGSSGGNTRPASSGESELSVSGVSKDKKDKKGVFGGLFSRKKRPQIILLTRNNNLWITQRVAPCRNRNRYTLRDSQLPSHRTNSAV